MAKRGDLLIIPPGVVHEVRHQSPVTKLRVIAIHLHLSNTSGLPLMKRFGKYAHHLQETKYWLNAFLNLTLLWNKNHFIGETSAKTLLPWFFISLLEANYPLDLSSPDVDPRVALALKRIHQQKSVFPAVSELARACELCEAQFRKIFLKEIGESPKEYIIRHRLRLAVELLKTTHKKVGEIARLVGFDYGPHFHLMFHKRFGCSPRAYRNGTIF